ncbi:brefeldin A-inhibited guanine nucleotide-exchange protein 5, partial [Fagus crenata]
CLNTVFPENLQKKYWSKLKAPQKIAVMEIFISLLDFAASYNSYTNLRLRKHQNTDERPPDLLLGRQISMRLSSSSSETEPSENARYMQVVVVICNE